MVEWWNWLLPISGWLPLIVAILAILGVGFKVGSWTKGISERFDKVENRFKNVESSVSLILFLHREELFKLYDRFFPPHQSSLSEKEKLLAKLREGTITPEEAERLKPLLEKQKSEAFTSGLIGAAVVIGGLLLIIGVISALAGEKKR